jgi:hypothetical protein
MKKVMIADLIKESEIPEPGDLEDAGIENVIDLSPIGIATYEHNPEHDVYIVTLKLEKGGESIQYVLHPQGLKDLIELGTKYFYQEMESNTFDMQKAIDSKDKRMIDILDLINEFNLLEEDAVYLYDNFEEADYEWVVEVSNKLDIPIKEVIEDSGIDHIDYLVQQVEAELMELDDAQEDAWVYYGYPEDSEVKQTRHNATHGTLFGGSSESTITVRYEPIFESLGDTLDDTPYWEVYVDIDTKGDYPHSYSGSAENKELEAIQALEETDSVMQWFNEYCGDHRYS